MALDPKPPSWKPLVNSGNRIDTSVPTDTVLATKDADSTRPASVPPAQGDDHRISENAKRTAPFHH